MQADVFNMRKGILLHNYFIKAYDGVQWKAMNDEKATRFILKSNADQKKKEKKCEFFQGKSIFIHKSSKFFFRRFLFHFLISFQLHPN